MRRTFTLLIPVAFLVVGCADQPSPAAPDVSPSFAAGGERSIRLQDQCDAATFPAGLCVSSHGGIRFDNFIKILTQTQSVGAWTITPSTLGVEEGETLTVRNVGGEEHTFTEVEDFGGGINATLNALSGNTTVAPECANLNPADRVPAGQSMPHIFDEEGVEKYQCCIHPWMRQIVHVRG